MSRAALTYRSLLHQLGSNPSVTEQPTTVAEIRKGFLYITHPEIQKW